MDETDNLGKKIVEFLQKLETNQKDFSNSFPRNQSSLSKEETKKLSFFLQCKEKCEKINNELTEYQILKQEENDKENRSILKQEIDELTSKKNEILEKVKEEIIKEEKIKQNVLIEIRPGTGGIEAGLFTGELYRMYYKFADKKKWKVELIETSVDSAGNFNFVAFLVKGNEVFNYLKYEAGVHRVQRVPATESKGRIHTSTATVVILPEGQEVNINLQTKDLRIETCRSGGAGGQHVNTTDSAVRITHVPTGIVATSQDGRSQHDNKEKALFVLKTRLFAKYQAEQEEKVGNLRSSAIGTAERAEKIRTYNYPQNRITDHRVNTSWKKLNFIIEGDLEEVCQALRINEIEQKLDHYQGLLINKAKIT